MLHWKFHQYAEDKMPELLQPVECSECVMYIWFYFLDMCKRRPSSGFGACPISEEGVMAWARRRGLSLLPFENKLLDAVEQVFLRITNKPKEAQ